MSPAESVLRPTNVQATVAGGTGLVGGFLVKALCQSPAYSGVRALGRRPVDVACSKLDNQICDLGALQARDILGTQVFCCLGTTIKDAGSKQAFRRVDLDYVVSLAQVAKQAGVQHFHLVSAIGSGADSRVFYSQVKGQAEQAVIDLGFVGTHIYQPSLLLGQRSKPRRGETLATHAAHGLNWMLAGPLSQYKAIHAQDLAQAMLTAAVLAQAGLHIYRYQQRQTLCRQQV